MRITETLFKKVYDFKVLIAFICRGLFYSERTALKYMTHTKAESFLRIAYLFWEEFVNKK